MPNVQTWITDQIWVLFALGLTETWFSSDIQADQSLIYDRIRSDMSYSAKEMSTKSGQNECTQALTHAAASMQTNLSTRLHALNGKSCKPFKSDQWSRQAASILAKAQFSLWIMKELTLECCPARSGDRSRGYKTISRTWSVTLRASGFVLHTLARSTSAARSIVGRCARKFPSIEAESTIYLRGPSACADEPGLI